MKCRVFVFLQSSGQLPTASLPLRTQARLHRWMCQGCGSFAANDEALSRSLAAWRHRLTPEDPPDAQPPAAGS